MADLGLGSSTGQTLLMGGLFFFVFMAYFMIQGFSATLYGDKLGANMESTLYLTFTIACFMSPSIVNKLGCRFGMFVGILGYATLVAASLVYFLLGADPAYSGVVVAGGGILGVGAAMLWTAQGRLILEYSGDGSDAGRLWALFWGVFNLSAVAGGILTSTYFASHSGEQGSVTLYVIFLGLILTGALGTFLLRRPEDVVRTRGDEEVAGTRTAPKDPAAESWAEEARSTLQLFMRRRYLVLTMIYFYTGFNQPYQIVTMGHRAFTATTMGLQLSLFYAAEIVGGFVAGKLLDSGAAGLQRRRAAAGCLFLFAALMGGGYLLALAMEKRFSFLAETGGSSAMSFGSGGEPLAKATAMMILWGFSDSQIQTYAMWDIGVAHAGDGATQARAVGFYKMVQSAGWCVGFALSPVSRLPPVGQWGATAAAGVIGTALACLELPQVGSAAEHKIA